MLFHWLEGSNVGVDIEQFVGRLGEHLDLERLNQAWHLVAERYDILRTQFAWEGLAAPVQEVREAAEVSLAVHDASAGNEEDFEAELTAFLAKDRSAGFDLGAGPLWRLTVFTTGPSTSTIVFTYHHSLLDTSVVWVVDEAFAAYDALGEGREPQFAERLPYRDHTEWLSEHLASNRSTAQDYFRNLLDGYDDPIRLQAIEATSDTVQSGYRHDRFGVPAEISQALHSFTERHGFGPPVLIEAAWALVLSAFSGANDIVFGSTRGCRRSGVEGSDTSIGLFINTPPVRLELDPAETGLELVSRVRQQQRDKRAHEHTALTDVIAVSPSHGGELFESIVVINERHQGTRLKEINPGFANRSFDLHDQTNTPLNLLAFTDDDVHFKLSYDLRRFSPEGLFRVRELFVAILGALAADPTVPVGELPRVPESDHAELAAVNDTSVPLPEATIVSLFEAQSQRSPDAVATVFRTTEITYRELDERANAAAIQLRDLGVVADTMVGVLMDRSVEMLVALLAIQKAGGAYVPMDPQYPASRIEMMLEDSAAPIVYADIAHRTSVPTSVATVLGPDDLQARSADRSDAEVDGNDLAYVIFTSGSTGRPKGVQLEHRNVVNFFTGMDDALGHSAESEPGVWLAVTSISFDISVLELFWTLTRGFTVVIQEEESRFGESAATSSAMDFSLFYFASAAGSDPSDRYRLLIEGAKFADSHGFTAVWTPERHFHEFGGIYPNPALTGAAVAMVTENVGIRAGSVVLPLHNPIRCAEDWSVVDNLSKGRVGLSFASGWHANDFVLAPDNYENRRQLMADGIETVLALWRGESVTATGGAGTPVDVTMYPPPIQTRPPLWVTAGGSPATFENAGRLGASILTNLLVMNEEDLVANVTAYRKAYREAGHEGNGHVSLMLHTFVGADDETVRRLVREPFLEYLRTSTDLINKMQWEQTSFAKAGLSREQQSGPDLADLSDEDMAAIMDHAFDRYFRTAGLFGTPESCVATIDRLNDLGVDEVACLIDFGVDDDEVLASLEHLDRLRRLVNTAVSTTDTTDGAAENEGTSSGYGLIDQMNSRAVTHFQCTPSHASVVVATPGGLAALARLDKLMLGGEALPQALADRLRPQIRGGLLNMYGPTETTIWSSVAPVEAAGQQITIGKPIANTEIHIVDPAMRANPIGVPGELLIGGAGVARGYLHRPELTAERFINLPAAGGRRVYRTGDLARILPNGNIEFHGRLDDQVKIRGYRIELGEIETVIGRHDTVREAVVVARPGATGEPQLVAYMVPDDTEPSGRAAAWGELWDSTYAQGDASDAAFDATGWLDSYTGEPVPAEQMADWVDHTVARINELSPQRVLEIGCGTGMILFRLAPAVDRYVGLDLSHHAVSRIQAQATALGLDQVEVSVGAADALRDLPSERFDTIVINSVAQYFPSADYLVEVIRGAIERLEPGGTLFLGDLRSHRHAPLMAADIELAHADEGATIASLGEAAALRVEADSELVIDHRFFDHLVAELDELADRRIMLKVGSFDNEMSRFRYDVTLCTVGGEPVESVDPVTAKLDTSTAATIAEGLATVLAETPPLVRVTGISNARLTASARAHAAALAGKSGTVGSLREEPAAGLRTTDLLGLVDGYDIHFEWNEQELSQFDMVLTDPKRRVTATRTAVGPGEWSSYTNTPAQHTTSTLVPDVRGALRESLPEFMVPSAFVLLGAMPRTPNGKIDRKALPSPRRDRGEAAAESVAAEGDIETAIVGVWQNLLALDTIGVETNVFDLGANSLLMVQASTQISAAVGQDVSLVTLFRYPTVRSLAASLGPADGGTAVEESRQRGASRREAMQRQRDTRRRR